MTAPVPGNYEREPKRQVGRFVFDDGQELPVHEGEAHWVKVGGDTEGSMEPREDGSFAFFPAEGENISDTDVGPSSVDATPAEVPMQLDNAVIEADYPPGWQSRDYRPDIEEDWLDVVYRPDR